MTTFCFGFYILIGPGVRRSICSVHYHCDEWRFCDTSLSVKEKVMISNFFLFDKNAKQVFVAISIKWAALNKKIPCRNRTPAKKARTSPSSKSEDKTKENNEGKVSSSSQPKSLASKLAQFARSEPSRDARQADSDDDFQKERKGLLDTLHFTPCFL